MITSAELSAAVREGIISSEQADALQGFVARPDGNGRPSGEEDLRFIRNFHDIFLSVGIAIFGIGLAMAVSLFSDGDAGVRLAISGFVCSAVMWGMAEFFARRRRLFLPAITLSIGFVLFFVLGVGALLAQESFGNLHIEEASDVTGEFARFWMITAGSGVLASAAFVARFRLPFAWGLAAVWTSLFAFAAIAYVSPQAVIDFFGPIVLTTGLGAFFAAIAFDMRDPERRTIASDSAFWLHLAAAPQILFGLLTTVFGFGGWGEDPQTAALTLAIVAILGLIGLAINRRALLVSALSTVGLAIAVLVRSADLDGGVTAAVTLIVLGGGVVLLGAGWHAARRAILAPLPKTGPLSRLFPPENAPVG